MTTPQPVHRLDYGRRRASRVLVWWVQFIAWTLVAALLLCLLLFVVPRFGRVFRDFQVKLPYATRLVLFAGRWITTDSHWLSIFAFPPAIATVVCLFTAGPGGPRPWRASAIGLRSAWIVLLLAVVLILVGLLLPMFSLM
jgi:fumarate reductase subunit D